MVLSHPWRHHIQTLSGLWQRYQLPSVTTIEDSAWLGLGGWVRWYWLWWKGPQTYAVEGRLFSLLNWDALPWILFCTGVKVNFWMFNCRPNLRNRCKASKLPVKLVLGSNPSAVNHPGKGTLKYLSCGAVLLLTWSLKRPFGKMTSQKGTPCTESGPG